MNSNLTLMTFDQLASLIWRLLMTVGDTQCIEAAMEPPRKLQRVSACPKATQKMTIRVRQRHQILYVGKDYIKDTKI